MKGGLAGEAFRRQQDSVFYKTAVQGFITAMLDFGLTTHNVSGIGCQYEKTLLLANDSVQR